MYVHYFPIAENVSCHVWAISKLNEWKIENTSLGRKCTGSIRLAAFPSVSFTFTARGLIVAKIFTVVPYIRVLLDRVERFSQWKEDYAGVIATRRYAATRKYRRVSVCDKSHIHSTFSEPLEISYFTGSSFSMRVERQNGSSIHHSFEFRTETGYSMDYAELKSSLQQWLLHRYYLRNSRLPYPVSRFLGSTLIDRYRVLPWQGVRKYKRVRTVAKIVHFPLNGYFVDVIRWIYLRWKFSSQQTSSN